MTVSILNDLSSNDPGSTSILKAEITISQPIITALSSFIVVIPHPFSFSISSLPTTF